MAEVPAVPESVVPAPVENDDAGQDYVQAQRPSRAELVAKARAKDLKHRQRVDTIKAIDEIEPQVEKTFFSPVTEFFADGAPKEQDGFFDNTKEVVLTAAETAAEGIMKFAGDAGDSIESINPYLVFGTDPALEGTGVNVFGMNIGFMGKDEFDLRKIEYEVRTGERVAMLKDFNIPDADRPDSPAGQMAADAARWMMIFAATRNAMGTSTGTAANLAKGAAAGFAADLTAFAPHEERLSKMISEWGEGNPAFDNAVTQYLAEDADSNMENRLKHAIEGLGIGLATESVFLLFKWYKGVRSANKFKDTPAGDVPLVDDIKPLKEEVEAAKAKISPDDSTNTKFLKEKEAADAAQGKAPPKAEAPSGSPVEPTITIRDSAKTAFKFKNNVDAEKFVADFQNGDFSKLGEMTEFNESTIDWNAVDNPEALRELLRGLEDAASDMLGEAGKAKVSFAASKTMAKQIGHSEEKAYELFGATQAEGGLTARMIAAQQAMVANAKRLLTLGEVATNGGQKEVAEFHQALQQQAALMSVVKGSSREIARAMANMRQLKDAAADSFEAFGEIMERHGGVQGTRKLVTELSDQHNLHDLHKVVEKTTKAGFLDWVQEVAINGMLSSLKTHVVNVSSNTLMGFVITPIERLLAGTIGLRNNRYAMSREIRAVIRTYTAIPYAGRLALKALKDGAPVSDMRQRVEVLQRQAIRATPEDWSKTTRPIAHAINALGHVVRVPGRALVAADEFFKGVTREGELTAIAYEAAARAADIDGLKGAPRSTFIKTEMQKLLANPSAEMLDDATSAARRATFQEDAQTIVGGRVAGALNSNPIIKLVIAPFVKTPMNLLRQAFMDRNPVMSLWAKGNLDAVKQGGAVADMVYARMLTGAGIMWTGYELAASGFITGKGESYDNTEKLDNIPEYAIRFGDEWIQYNRFDPVGGILGLIADLHYGFTHGYDPHNPEGFTEYEHAARTVFAAITNNALSKTWAKSMNDIIESAELYLDGSPGASRRAVSKLAGENLFKLVPYGSAVRNYAGAEDPVFREAWSVMERIQKNLPGWSEDLPKKRDLLGRPITRDNAESYMYNPFAPVPESKDPVDIELAQLEFKETLLDKSIEGVPMDATQYSRYKELIGDLGIPGAPTLYETIKEVISGPSWNQMTDPMKVDVIKDLISSRKQIAKQLLLNENEFDLRKRVLQVERYGLEQYTGKDLSEFREAIDSINTK